MNFNIYILAGVGIILLLLIVWIIRLEMTLRKLLAGKGGTIDTAIDALRSDSDALKKYAESTGRRLQVIDKKLAKAISGNETIRFNPWKGDGSGSNQSFATALVNAEGDGVIISSLYSRDHISVFSKPVKNLKSEYELSAEEKTALQKATESIV